VYTARVKVGDENYLEWTLHQLSNTSGFEQLQSDWFYLSGICNSTPINAYTNGQLPIPLLKAGFKHPKEPKFVICSDESFDDDQFIYFPNIIRYDHIIGNLYSILVSKHGNKIIYLIDIDKKEMPRSLDQIMKLKPYNTHLITGRITSMTLKKQELSVMEKCGAL
jgi:hypothetical protein